MPGLAALGALLFTWMQVGQQSKELRIAEHGEITSRFNNAIGNLGSQSLDIRLGGIYALQRIMQDSARDQPTVVSVLAAFVQRHAGSSTKSLKESADENSDSYSPAADVKAAIAMLARRRPDRDSGTVIDLSKSDFRGLSFTGKAPIKLPGAQLDHADLRWADLSGWYSLVTPRAVDLRKVSLLYANLEEASLERANLSGADLSGAHFSVAVLEHANLRGADMTCAGGVFDEETQEEVQRTDCVDLQDALMKGADLRNAKMIGARLSKATLTGADLRYADLTDADLTGADLTNADFRGAKMTGAKLNGALRSGARGLPQES
ncbi:pentapeptide repeat-containing protein [Streptomyces sp. NPDC005263]|uniref:pentapeptide repeat-containing protein n=1 Tax=Streptomyces sp. NPDC005263 TaxID=3364711 RepID=UPI0036793732